MSFAPFRPPFKTMTREEFNRSAIGARMAASGLIAALEGGGVSYNEIKPFFIHEVIAPGSPLGNSYYALHGWHLHSRKIYATLTFGNGGYLPGENKLGRHGDDCDRFDIQFIVPTNGDPVTVAHINKYRSQNAEPANEAETDAVLREAEAFLARLEAGGFVNFQREKARAWTGVPHRAGVLDILAESWARSRRDTPDAPRLETRRLRASGSVYANRIYVPAAP
jgi:hypothetical protein